MSDNIFPDGLEEEEDELGDEELEDGYNGGYKFDGSDFLRDGSGRVVKCDGVEAWKQWCLKSILTPRFSCLAYSEDIGIDMEEVREAKNREEVETTLEFEITEALEADPSGRTEYVESVIFEWLAPDSVEVIVEVVGMGNVLVDVKAVVNI